MISCSISDSNTRLSLIQCMINGSTASNAWALFIDKYGRKLYGWARQWCTNHHDAEELVQDTLMIVFCKIGVFQSKSQGGFRHWVKEISYRCWLEMLARRKKYERPLNDQLVIDHQRAIAENQMAREELEKLFDQIADREILDLAMARARVRVRERTWKAFVMVELKGESVDHVSEILELSRGAVYTAVCTVKKLIKEETIELDKT
jgi:RNA polymerase sigma factor (sigma-70 family)